MNIKPTGDSVAVEFLEDFGEEETTDQGTSSYDSPETSDSYRTACAALCVGVGKEVKVCKKGDTVLVRESARNNAIEVGKDTCIVSSYAIVATITP